MNYKILSFMIFGIFLLSMASATIAVYGEFSDGSHSADINADESIMLTAVFSSTDLPITTMKLEIPSGLNAEKESCEVSVSGHTNTCLYSITANIVGTYTLTLIGRDSTGSTDCYHLTLKVTSAPTENHAPDITSTPVTQVNEGTHYSYDVDATDEDGDDLTYSLTEKPEWLSINSDTGLISGTSPYIDADTSFTVQVRVSDGSYFDIQTYSLKVKNKQCSDTIPPVITLLGPNPQTVTKGNSYHEWGATAWDNIDGDISSKIVIDSDDVDTDVVGTYHVYYSVSDNAGNPADLVTRTVHVVKGTSYLEITVIVPVDNKEYHDEDLKIKVRTNKEAEVTFRLDEGTVKDMHDSGDNVFTYSLKDLSEGTHHITFYAEDDEEDEDTETVSFSIDTNDDEDEDDDDCDSCSKVIKNLDDGYNQKKDYIPSGTGDIIYADKPAKTSDFSIVILFYIIIAVLILGLVIILLLLVRKMGR